MIDLGVGWRKIGCEQNSLGLKAGREVNGRAFVQVRAVLVLS